MSTAGIMPVDNSVLVEQDEKNIYPEDDIKIEQVDTPLVAVPHEVRAVVPDTDDVNEPCETFRAYLLGSFWAIVATGVNVWFSARQPGLYLSAFLAQFLSQPAGVFLAKVLPTRHFTVLGFTFTLNPGPWSIKEHGIATLMATVALPTATAIEAIAVIKLPTYFGDEELGGNLGWQFLTTISTQFLGFGIAGLAREFLVYPSAMIWPLNLAKVSLFNALHRRTVDEDGNITTHTTDEASDPAINGWKISAFRFCLYAVIGSFCWFWVTEIIFPFLLYFNWPTWIAPDNAKLAIMMGSITGVGLNPIPTFDWTYISGAGLTPLITPWWASLQVFIGCTIGLFVLIGLYFSNTWYSAYLLPNSNAAFDRFGDSYNVTKVLTSDYTLDVAAYEAYSPLYYAAGYNLVIGAYFASYSATLCYAGLEHWHSLKLGSQIGYRKIKSLITRKPMDDLERDDVDIHYKLMKAYPEVPQWWFAAITALALVLGIISAEVYNTTMPVWGIFCCLALSFVFLIPAGIIQAASNISISLVVLAEIIPGVAIPGRPYANMIFKLYGWISLYMALAYVQDQKLGHYLHIPPRAVFRAQMLACLFCSIVSVGVLNWQFNAVPDLCETGQKDLLTCPYYTSFFSSALLFGVVGPERVYGSNGLYSKLMWAFFVGAGLAVVAWAVKRKWPNKYTESVNIPVIITGAMYYAPYNWSFVWSGLPLAWTFMYYIQGRFPAWWNKYCYVLSIGLTVGAAVCAVFMFVVIDVPGAAIPSWWGNTFYAEGCDALGCPLKAMPEQGYFGPGPGEF